VAKVAKMPAVKTEMKDWEPELLKKICLRFLISFRSITNDIL